MLHVFFVNIQLPVDGFFRLHAFELSEALWLPESVVYRAPCIHELSLAPLRTRAPPLPLGEEGGALASEGLLYNSGTSGNRT